MKTIDKGTLTRTILLWLAILNQILTALGINPLPLDDNTVSTVITTVFALWAWWKN
ncbi:phage holin, partial [Citrobacter sp. TBCS-11]